MKTVTLTALLALAPLAANADAPDPKVERLWKAKCASCHGVDGKAQTEQGKKMKMHDLSTAAWQKSFTDAQIKKVTEDGVNGPAEGVQKQMDAYKAKLQPAQIDQLVAYVRSLGPK